MNSVQIISMFASGYEISTWRQNPKLSCIYISNNIESVPRLIFWNGVKEDFVESLKLSQTTRFQCDESEWVGCDVTSHVSVAIFASQIF